MLSKTEKRLGFAAAMTLTAAAFIAHMQIAEFNGAKSPFLADNLENSLSATQEDLAFLADMARLKP